MFTTIDKVASPNEQLKERNYITTRDLVFLSVKQILRLKIICMAQLTKHAKEISFIVLKSIK
jgi:hypothetical protein